MYFLLGKGMAFFVKINNLFVELFEELPLLDILLAFGLCDSVDELFLFFFKLFLISIYFFI